MVPIVSYQWSSANIDLLADLRRCHTFLWYVKEMDLTLFMPDSSKNIIKIVQAFLGASGLSGLNTIALKVLSAGTKGKIGPPSILTHMLLVANLANAKNLKNDWNPDTWVLTWDSSVRAF